MKRKAAVVTAVGHCDGRAWCTLDQTIFSPGDTGSVGPFHLTEVEKTPDGRMIHYFKPACDLLVGELLALIAEETDVLRPGQRAAN